MNKVMLNRKNISLLLIGIMVFSIMLMTGLNLDAQRLKSENGINDLISKLDEKLPKLMKASGVPGVQIALLDGDKIVTKEYGYSDKGAKTEVTKDTIFQIGSVSKMVAAWGVMKLVEEGKLDLDEPVEKYLTRWHLPESQFDNSGVTVRRLLSHTAGLSLQGYAGVKPDQELVTIEESLSGAEPGIGDVRVVLEPGSKFKYSGGGYTLLQLLVEEVSGMSFEKYLEENVLKPLNMNSSTYEVSEDILAKTSKAYGAIEQKIPNYIYTEKAAAGLYTTAEDLAKLGMEIINPTNKVLKADTVNLMTERVGDTNWGLGLQIMSLNDEITAVGHGGANRGWRAQVDIITDKKQGIVMLTNGEMGDDVTWEIMSYWTEMITGKLPKYNQAMHSEERTAQIIAVVIGLLFAIFGAITLISVIKGKRKLANLSQRHIVVRILRLLVPVIVVAAWWIGLYGPLFLGGWCAAGFLPYSVKWVTLDITLWCVLLMITGLLPKEKKAVKKEKGLSA